MIDEPTQTKRMILYAGIGPELVRFGVSLDGTLLTRLEATTLPANVQYGCRHVSGRYLYVATSNGAPAGGAAGDRHDLSAFHIAPGTGILSSHGGAVQLPHRPIHISTDMDSKYALLAFNNPATVCVYRINPDGTLGIEVPQNIVIRSDLFVHQIMITPDNRKVTLVGRGSDATGAAPEAPGGLMVFDFEEGVLSHPVLVAPNEGVGFGPRDLEFHPSRQWVYMSLERQNELAMFDWAPGSPAPTLRCRKGTLAEPHVKLGRQIAGVVHLHPNGRTAYVANRASATIEEAGKKVFAGGENSIAVFALDPENGEPTLIQNIDSRGIHPRTFQIDSTGRLLLAAHTMGLTVRRDDGLHTVPVCLTALRIADDGTLEFVAAHIIDTGGSLFWWIGLFGEHDATAFGV